MPGAAVAAGVSGRALPEQRPRFSGAARLACLDRCGIYRRRCRRGCCNRLAGGAFAQLFGGRGLPAATAGLLAAFGAGAAVLTAAFGAAWAIAFGAGLAVTFAAAFMASSGLRCRLATTAASWRLVWATALAAFSLRAWKRLCAFAAATFGAAFMRPGFASRRFALGGSLATGSLLLSLARGFGVGFAAGGGCLGLFAASADLVLPPTFGFDAGLALVTLATGLDLALPCLKGSGCVRSVSCRRVSARARHPGAILFWSIHGPHSAT